MDRQNVTFIHPVHAVFPFADLSHESVSLERFLDLLEGLNPEDRYLLIDDVAALIGLKPCKPLSDLDRQLRRCRLFKNACLQLEIDKSLVLRGVIQYILNRQFAVAWPDFHQQLSHNTISEQNTVLSCDRQTYDRNYQELWNSHDPPSWQRTEAYRLYNLFCDRVVGPLIGYC